MQQLVSSHKTKATYAFQAIQKIATIRVRVLRLQVIMRRTLWQAAWRTDYFHLAWWCSIIDIPLFLVMFWASLNFS